MKKRMGVEKRRTSARIIENKRKREEEVRREIVGRMIYEKLVKGVGGGLNAKSKALLRKWSKGDHSWFDKGRSAGEALVTKTLIQCSRCDKIDGLKDKKCEQSLLFELYDTNWRYLLIKRTHHRVDHLETVETSKD